MVAITPEFVFLASIVLQVNAVAIPRGQNGNVVLPRHAQILGPHHVAARHSNDDKKKAKEASESEAEEDPAPAKKSGKGGKSKSPHRSASPQLVLPALAHKKGKGGKATSSKKSGKKAGGHGGKHDRGSRGNRHHSRMFYDADSSRVKIGPLDIEVLDHHEHTGVLDKIVSFDKREVDRAWGTIDIMTASATSSPHRIAQMFLNRTSSTSDFVLDASEHNSTQFFMVQQPGATASSEDRQVSLRMPVFNSTAAQMTEYCVCFDPHASSPEPMTMCPCFDSASQATESKSQTFSYNSLTNAIRPMWFNGQDDGFSAASTEDEVDPASPASKASVTSFDEGPSSNSTSATNGTASAASSTNGTTWDTPAASNHTLTARDAFKSQAQNVTLQFTPSTAQVGSESVDVSNVPSSATPSASSSFSSSSSVQLPTSSSSPSSSAAPSATGFNMFNVEQSSSSPPTSTVLVTSTETATTTMTLLQVSEVASQAPLSSTVTSYSTFIVTEYASVSSDESTMTVASAEPSSATSTTTSASAEVNASAVAERIAAGSSTASSSTAPESTTVGVESFDSFAADHEDATPSSSSEAPSMTAVSTAPYSWMFSPESR